MVFFDSGQVQLLISVTIATLLGAVLGFDREFSHKPAGLRTHMLVASASTLLVGVSSLIVKASDAAIGHTLIQSDPIRIIEAVITGVSFLGAGTIIRRVKAGEVEGLTTAASLLMAAAIGICVALSQLLLAIGATFLALLMLRGVQWLAEQVKQHQ